ncbi:HNH endonuclease [Marinobacter salsuginis]|uniref:HNH endonuclease n=1 Tax=Marinobacter salsuginis TaxID=418719 RepID=UPI001C938720|nr:HNH endonuclease [Marinobacter salsuginis]
MWNSDLQAFAIQHSLSLKKARNFQCTGEHLLAHSEGGSASSMNIVAACKFCNSKRHARKTAPEPRAFADLVQKRLEKGAWNNYLWC